MAKRSRMIEQEPPFAKRMPDGSAQIIGGKTSPPPPPVAPQAQTPPHSAANGAAKDGTKKTADDLFWSKNKFPWD